jgi:hypothetical protein
MSQNLLVEAKELLDHRPLNLTDDQYRKLVAELVEKLADDWKPKS